MKNKHLITQWIAFIIFILCVFSGKLFAQNGNKVVVGYLPTYSNFPNAIYSADLNILTHVDIAFVNPDWNGNINMPGGTATVVNAAHAKNVKVLASICGGGGDGNTYRNILSNNNLTNTFVANLVQLCLSNNLDGIDVDIEGDVLNGTYVTAAQYESFILKLRDALHAQNKLMTAALAGWFAQHVTNTAAQAFDFIGLMSYDAYGGWTGPGQHSPYEMAVNDFNFWRTNKGVVANKLVIGLPFYGYGWGSNQRAWTFNEITNSFPGSENNDQVGSGANVIYYNGIPSIQRKCDFAKENALGVMIWELTQDASGAKSLLQAIGKSMGSGNTNAVPDNLAKYKTVSASSTETGMNLAAVTDGFYNTRWSSNYTNNEWIYVDLGETYNINRVKITWETASAKNYQVQFSNDAQSWTNTKIVTNNNALINDYVDVKGKARYVRIFCTSRNTNYGYSIYELEVYGSAIPKPYGGTAINIPGIIQAENYDLGGEGVAYHDLTASNTHGAFRTDAVDIEACTDNGGGFNVGGTQAGEWMNYSVAVTKAGVYDFRARVAAVSAGKTFHLELDGINISGPITVPNTGGWQSWQTIGFGPLSLTAGNKDLRLVMDSELININYLEIAEPVITSASILSEKPLSVFPNPCQNYVHYQLPIDSDDCSEIKVYSILGELFISEMNCNKEGGIDLSHLSSGIYQVRILDNNNKVYQTLIIKN